MRLAPLRYGSANPIFGGYIADSVLAHNTIRESAYSGVCLGWGWGASSFMRNVHAVNNSIANPMLRLQDGGGTALSGSISTVLTGLSWICAGICMREALPSPVCA